MDKARFDELVTKGCPQCGRHQLKLKSLATGTIEVLQGDAVSPLKWGQEIDPSRIYRAECVECGAVLFERDDCPMCRAPGRLKRVLAAQNGLPPPSSCPRCDYQELTLTVEARLRLETLHGRISRRVAEAEIHEPGFHIAEAHCPSCEETVIRAGDARCVACGRSSLMRDRGLPR